MVACRSDFIISALGCQVLSFSESSVKSFVNLLQTFISKVRVNLRRGNGGMPEDFLDRTQIRARGQKIGRHGMAQGVWGDVMGNARQSSVFFNQTLNRTGSERRIVIN